MKNKFLLILFIFIINFSIPAIADSKAPAFIKKDTKYFITLLGERKFMTVLQIDKESGWIKVTIDGYNTFWINLAQVEAIGP